MKSSHRFPISCLLATAVWAACTPPPEPVEPTVPTATTPATKLPAPPQCESLDEKCKATAKTRARIAGAPHRFTPPAGWFYAQLGEATVAQSDSAGPVIVISAFEPETTPAALRKQREQRLAALCEMAGLTLPPKTTLAQPDETGEASGLKLLFWQREHVKRGSDDGSLLVFAGLHEGVELFGIGFVTSTDTTQADEAIEASLQSLRPDDEASGKPPGASDKDDAP